MNEKSEQWSKFKMCIYHTLLFCLRANRITRKRLDGLDGRALKKETKERNVSIANDAVSWHVKNNSKLVKAVRCWRSVCAPVPTTCVCVPTAPRRPPPHPPPPHGGGGGDTWKGKGKQGWKKKRKTMNRIYNFFLEKKMWLVGRSSLFSFTKLSHSVYYFPQRVKLYAKPIKQKQIQTKYIYKYK